MKESKIKSLPENSLAKDSESVESESKEKEVKRSREGRLRRGIYLLPNLITSGALFSGFYAIISAMSGSLINASIAIGVAAFLDALDGRIARVTNTESEFGAQYDSLSDMVAFGVAPAVLMFIWILSDMGNIGWMVGFLYMACAALRLARYNTQPDNSSFTGLASPAAAGVLAALVWVWHDNSKIGAVSMEVSILFTTLTAIVALLMVSNITYYSPKTINLKGRVPFRVMLGVIFLLAVILVNPPLVLLILVSAYAFGGPVQALCRKMGFFRNKADAAESTNTD